MIIWCWAETSVSSVGTDAWGEKESRVMPRNSRDVLGPSVFSGKRGTLSSVNVEVMVMRLYDGVKMVA